MRYAVLKELLRAYIEKNILPKVVPDQKKVIILDTGKDVEEYAQKKGVLIVTAVHDFIDYAEPHIMTLHISIYRPDMGYIPPSEYVFMSPLGIITIPLNMPEHDMEKRVKISIKRYLQVY